MAVGTLIAVFALLSQVGDPAEFWDTISSANWWWLTLALIISFGTNVATAVSLMGTVPIRLPLWRTSELQLSMSFSNLAVPAVGGMAAQIRFLQKQGCDLASAVASGAVLANAANIFTNILLLGVALVLSPTSIRTGQIPTSEIVDLVLVVIALLFIVGGLIWFIPKLRNMVIPQLTSAATTIWRALRSPRRVAELMIGNTVNALMYAAVMMCCLEAFGGSLNYWTLLAINIVVGTSRRSSPSRAAAPRSAPSACRARSPPWASPPRSRWPRCSPTSWSPASSPQCPAGSPPRTS